MSGFIPLYGTILVPVKESVAGIVLPHAFALTRASGGRLVFLHVTPEPEDHVPGFLEELRSKGEAMKLDVSIERRAGEVVGEICKAAHHLQADLVLLVAHPGSDHVEQITRELFHLSDPMATPSPVMIVPNPMRRKAERGTVPPPRRFTY